MQICSLSEIQSVRQKATVSFLIGQGWVREGRTRQGSSALIPEEPLPKEAGKQGSPALRAGGSGAPFTEQSGNSEQLASQKRVCRGLSATQAPRGTGCFGIAADLKARLLGQQLPGLQRSSLLTEGRHADLQLVVSGVESKCSQQLYAVRREESRALIY